MAVMKTFEEFKTFQQAQNSLALWLEEEKIICI